MDGVGRIFIIAGVSLHAACALLFKSSLLYVEARLVSTECKDIFPTN